MVFDNVQLNQEMILMKFVNVQQLILEVQQILSDPRMRLILEQMHNERKALRDHLRNPAIAQKIQKLIDVSIISIH